MCVASPVCILMCALRVPASVSLFPHMLHVYGLSWYLGRAAVQGFGVVLTSQWTHSVFIRGLVKSPGYDWQSGLSVCICTVSSPIILGFEFQSPQSRLLVMWRAHPPTLYTLVCIRR